MVEIRELDHCVSGCCYSRDYLLRFCLMLFVFASVGFASIRSVLHEAIRERSVVCECADRRNNVGASYVMCGERLQDRAFDSIAQLSSLRKVCQGFSAWCVKYLSADI
jgi:hypothetical protein